MTIFSLLVLFIGTYAWFEAFLHQTDTGSNFEVKDIDGKLKNIYFHNSTSVVVDNNTGKPTSFIFDASYSGKISYNWETKLASYSGDTTIALASYTPMEHNKPLMLVFELDDTYSISFDGEITITAKTTQEGFIGARNANNNNAPVYSLLYSDENSGVYQRKNNASYFALSSVANFFCTDSSSELYNKDEFGNNTTLINGVYSYSSLKNREQSIAAKTADPEAVVPDLCFTSINNSNETSSFKQDPKLYTSKTGDSVKYICVILDYYEDAIDYIYSTFLGNDTLEYTFGNKLNFLCDWGLEIR